MDVGVGIVDEHAGLHVARCIDVQVAATTGDAAAHELTVILEVERKERLFLAHLAYKTIHVLTLFGRGHEL